MEFVNYAHRGASEYAPENTMAAFRLGLAMGANGLETDVRKTRDGVLVLFHDPNLLRICGRPESIHDLTYRELLDLDFGSHKGPAWRDERIAILEEFLKEFGRSGLHLAIELKEEGLEEETLQMIRRYADCEKTVITSFIWSSLLKTGSLDPGLQRGFLTGYLNEPLLGMLRGAGIRQVCPKAAILTAAWNQQLHEAGFSVRAWGVGTPEIMHRMLDLPVDGMTVNFPDILTEALHQRQTPPVFHHDSPAG